MTTNRNLPATVCDIGMVGLGVMGRNFLLNAADRGFSISGYDKDPAKIEELLLAAGQCPAVGTIKIEEFVSSLRRPRAVILLVPAGSPVDAVIGDLLPQLLPGDLIVDAGNSYFKDTDVRARPLAAQGILFLGMGISGGEKGARYGPSLMPGGPIEAYERVRPLLEAMAAKINDAPCIAYLGPGSAGHFVKMVHNGIEYAIMQLIAEAYDLMKRGLGLDDDELHAVFGAWSEEELGGYLMEITSHIFAQKDTATDKRLIDEILDEAKQKGTGMWTSQSAMELQVPTPTIDAAVAMRDLSLFAADRAQASSLYQRPILLFETGRDKMIGQLREALYAAMLIAYAQGFALLTTASERYGYRLNLEEVASIWRGGCIIRAALLDDIRAAFRTRPDLNNLLFDPTVARKVVALQENLRAIVRQAVDLGVPAPGFMASLGYLDALRSAWLPANLIQAQRDYFGAHTYERVDAKGTFHTEWETERSA